MDAQGRPTPGAASAELEAQAWATQRKTMAHLQAAASITEDTQRVAESTMEELARQGEQIERTQRKVDELDAQADKASYLLKGMKSVFGSIGNAFRGKPKDPKAAAEQASAVRAARRAKQAQAAGRPAPDPASLSAGAKAAGASAGAAASTTDASAPGGTWKAAQAEEDALLDVISANVSRIGEMGREMGAELTRQDRMLDDLSTSVSQADYKLKKTASVAKKMAS